MAMTEEERFRFDLTGFLVPSGNLDAPMKLLQSLTKPTTFGTILESLLPEHRAIPGGAASLLIDHPKVIEVLHRNHRSRCPTGGLWIDLGD